MPQIVNPNYSNLDQQQILQRAFDEAQDKLRVDASVSVTSIVGDVVVDIDAASGDNIAISNADGTKKATLTDVGSKTGLDVNVLNPAGDVTTPTIANIAAPTANTEYFYSLPLGTKRFILKSRNTGSMRLAFTSGATATTYFSISAGNVYEELNISDAASITLYFRSTKVNDVIEILSWL